MKPTAKSALATVVIVLLVLVAGGLVYMYSGAYNVAATRDHTALMTWILNTTQERSVSVRASHVPERPDLDSAAIVHGFEHFRAMCVQCHGAPGVERGEIGHGITPTPPELGHAVEEFSSEELYWIVNHGIKLAGMPAFGPTHSEEEIWGIVAFMEELPGMTAAEYEAWGARGNPPAAAR